MLSHNASYPGPTLNTNLQNSKRNVVTFTLKCYVDDFETSHSGEIFESLYLTETVEKICTTRAFDNVRPFSGHQALKGYNKLIPMSYKGCLTLNY